jgi:hypothetical protein
MGTTIPSRKANTMKFIKTLTTLAFAAALLAGTTAFAESCCDKAKAKGEECKHKCCVEAKKEGKVCEKCNKK